MNTLENRMSAMADHVVASTLERKSFVRELKGSTSRLLSRFAHAHRNTSGSAKRERTFDRALSVSGVQEMRLGFRAELQNAKQERSQMAWTLSKELAIFTRALRGVEKSRHTEFNRSYRRMASNQRNFLSQDRSARCLAVAKMLKHCSESQAKMGKALAQDLEQFTSEIQDQVHAIKKASQQDLQYFRHAHHTMSTQLRHDLEADASVRRTDVKRLMHRFHVAQGEVRKDIQAAHCVLPKMRQSVASATPEMPCHAPAAKADPRSTRSHGPS